MDGTSGSLWLSILELLGEKIWDKSSCQRQVNGGGRINIIQDLETTIEDGATEVLPPCCREAYDSW